MSIWGKNCTRLKFKKLSVFCSVFRDVLKTVQVIKKLDMYTSFILS